LAKISESPGDSDREEIQVQMANDLISSPTATEEDRLNGVSILRRLNLGGSSWAGFELACLPEELTKLTRGDRALLVERYALAGSVDAALSLFFDFGDLVERHRMLAVLEIAALRGSNVAAQALDNYR